MSLNQFLEALEYPSAKTFQFSSRNELVTLVEWLEDRKIRALEIGERNSLRHNDEHWSASFGKYLQTLECPFAWPEGAADCVSWLVSHAINLEYEDIADIVTEEDGVDVSANMAQNGEASMMQDDDDNDMVEGISLEIDSLGTTVGLVRGKVESDAGLFCSQILHMICIRRLNFHEINISTLVVSYYYHSISAHAYYSFTVFLERVARRIHLFYSRSARESLDGRAAGAAGAASSETALQQFPLGFDTKGNYIILL